MVMINQINNKYRLGLEMGGLMEDPYFHVEDILDIEAPNLRTAKDIWATKKGYINLKDWDPNRQTYWCWQVKLIALNGMLS